MAILLRKVKLSDKRYFTKWWNDQDLRRLTSGKPGPISAEKTEKYLSEMINDKNEYHFIITLNRKAIGHVNLSKRKDNWYETQIIIGEKKYWGKGYGTEAIKQLTKQAKAKGISKIYLEVRPDNLRAIRAYEKCGFVGVGFKKYPKNKYLPITLRMELILSSKIDRKLANFLKLTQKELEKFFNIKIKPADIFLLESRKQIDSIRKEKTEPWVVGWVKNNTIYILNPDVFTKESSHKDVNAFWRTLKHEYSHIAIEQFCGYRCENPLWLIEGLCCYIAKQNKEQPTDRELSVIFKKRKLAGRELYVVGYFWVRFLIERFGKEKILRLFKALNHSTSLKQFAQKFYQTYKIIFSKDKFGLMPYGRNHRKVVFKFNKDLDKQMINIFLNYKKQGGINFSGCVLGPNPNLKKAIEERKNDRKKVINRYVEDVYRERKRVLNKRIKELSQRWSKLEKDYFKLVEGIFKLKTPSHYRYIGYLSIINCCPRFLESKSFQVFYHRPKDSMHVTMHEILHFFFYDYAIKKYPKIFKKLDTNQGIFWNLAEVFNSVILAQPEFKRIHKQKRDWSYPALRKYIPELKQYWEESKNIDDWILKSFKYLKNKKHGT